MIYLRRSSKSYQYAALILAGHAPAAAARAAGIAATTARSQRRRFRREAEKTFGYRPPYELLALMAVCPETAPALTAALLKMKPA